MTGTSSGAMMTNVLAGRFIHALLLLENSLMGLQVLPRSLCCRSSFSGVPYGCFAGSSNWNTPCAEGQLIKTAAAWGAEVKTGYLGYNGTRPRLQLWHGTADTTLYYQNLVEANKQCMRTNILIC